MPKSSNSLGPPGVHSTPRTEWTRDDYELEVAARDAELGLLRRELARLQAEATKMCRSTSDFTLEAMEKALGQQEKQHATEMADLERRRHRAEEAEQLALAREREALARRDSAWRHLKDDLEESEVRGIESADKKRQLYVKVVVAAISVFGTAVATAVAASWF